MKKSRVNQCSPIPSLIRCTSPPDVVPRPNDFIQIHSIPEESLPNGLVVENYFNEYKRQEIARHQPTYPSTHTHFSEINATISSKKLFKIKL